MARRRRRSWWHELRAAVFYGLLAVAAVHLTQRFGDRAEAPAPGARYDRAAWKHWIDADRDCLDTRHEVLLAESEIPVTFADAGRCRVTRGRWRCPFTGKVVYDAALLDVDHLVPLQEAHRAGGHGWSAARKRAYANDLRYPGHLVAVDRSANRAKGSDGPEAWLPDDPAYRCTYLRHWVAIKDRWQLARDPAEARAVRTGLAACEAGRVPPAPQHGAPLLSSR